MAKSLSVVMVYCLIRRLPTQSARYQILYAVLDIYFPHESKP